LQPSELNYFKEILEARKIQILKNIDGKYKELELLNSCELNDEGDHASVDNSAKLESTIIHQQKEELYEIDLALSKVASKEYGKCAMCDDLIGFQRLKVKPHAVYCINCRKIVEKSE